MPRSTTEKLWYSEQWLPMKPLKSSFSALCALFLFGFIAWNLFRNWPAEDDRPLSSSSRLQASKGAKGDSYGASSLALSGFSAVQVAADAHASRNSDEFLTTYLEQHFPVPLTDSDMELMRQSIQQSQDLPDVPSNHYKTGVYFFFLALAESMKISCGEPASSPLAVTALWRKSVAELKKGRELAQPLAGYVEEIVVQADRDRDQQLSEREIESIVGQHIFGQAN